MPHHLVYLAGEWIEGDEQRIFVVNPATGEPFATVAAVGARETTRAVEAAQTALPAWSGLPATARADFLLALGAEIARRGDEIATTITRESGKPLAQSRAEVALSVDHLRWFAEEARRVCGRLVPPQVAGKRHLVLHTPVGVVGAISPWNFPLVLVVRKVAPALAAGCPVVVKPSEKTPLSALLLAECAHAARLPAGALSVLIGAPQPIADVFFAHSAVRKITFTGSTAVGKQLIRASAEGVKRLSLELGGQAPLLVFADADLEVAVREAVKAKTRNAGQACIAANRFYVERSVFDEFAARFTKAMKNLTVGNGLDEKTDIGPMIDAAGRDKALAHIADARDRGARVLCGGEGREGPGFFVAPTVLADVPPGALCLREETFGPVAPLVPFDSEEEAITLANESPFGLAAYAFTRDVSRVFRLAEQVEAGTLGINDGIPTTSQAPFGGYKQSGLGRELGSEGLQAFLETKHVSIGIEPHGN